MFGPQERSKPVAFCAVGFDSNSLLPHHVR
jgi:hypothetical protein